MIKIEYYLHPSRVPKKGFVSNKPKFSRVDVYPTTLLNVYAARDLSPFRIRGCRRLKLTVRGTEDASQHARGGQRTGPRRVVQQRLLVLVTHA